MLDALIRWQEKVTSSATLRKRIRARCFVQIAVVILILPFSLSATFVSAADAGPAAEILSIAGKGEFRDPQQTNWRAAKGGQPLQESQFVRTGDASKMGLLFADKTQMRLGQNSMMQLVSASRTKDQKTTIDLKQGRTWMQSKTTPGGLEIRTPSALAAIRGTDWELVVDDDGKTTLSVFSGTVDLSNDAGALAVGANEQATVAIGRAPVKTTLVNPTDRIQWVSSFVINPSRYAEYVNASQSSVTPISVALKAITDGRSNDAIDQLAALSRATVTDSAFVRLLLADCLIYGGDVTQADEVLRQGAIAFASDERFEIARARLALMRGNAQSARQRAEAARRIRDSAQVALLEGDVAAFNGEVAISRSAYERALRQAPQDVRALAGLGKIEAEKFNVDVARNLLQRASTLSPADAAILGEVGLNETQGGDTLRAAAAFDAALEIDPANYIVRAARAALRLRQGREEDALDELLRATVIEPRYARAHVFLSVVYYRMERLDRALESLARAKALDPNDPFAYQVASVMHGDHWQPEAAIAEAIGAMARLPYLKSLNQFADNQRGAANLGAALSGVGLEAWAQSLAQESYQPLWAGSHLFLADRYAGEYAKRAELMQGFLLDPLVFGAANRYQSILPRPGINLNASLHFARSRDASTEEPLVTISGVASADTPMAFFGEFIDTAIKPGNIAVDGRAKTYTAALGIKPAWDRGVFLYLNRLEANVSFGKAGVDGTFQQVRGDDTRADAAGNFAIDGATQIWLKAGYGRQSSAVDTASRSSNPIIPGLIAQQDSSFNIAPKSTDAQLRWTHVGSQRSAIAAGIEWAKTERAQQLLQDNFSHLPGAASPRSTLSVEDNLRSTFAYATMQREEGLLEWQVLLSYMSFSQPRRFSSVGPPPFSFRFEVADPVKRNGVAGGLALIKRTNDGAVIRMACSRWQRPASNGTLAPVAFGGMVIDDQLVNAGGLTDRCRFQIEQAFSSQTFVSASYDYQRINNLVSPIDGVINTGTEISNLDRLRSRVIAPTLNFNELESRPVFGLAGIRRVQLSVDQILAANFALRANYIHADSKNSVAALTGRAIPYVPQNQVNLWLNWTREGRGVFSVGPIYRSQRFADEENLVRIQAGWDTQVRGFWEWDRKHWAIEAFAQNLGKKQTARTIGANFSYRF